MTSWPTRIRALLSQPRFAGLLAATVALGFGFSFVSPVLSIWGTRVVGMRPSFFGFYMTMTALSSVFVATSLARWSDTHVPRKLMLLLGGAGGAVGYSCYAVIRQPWVLLGVAVSAVALTALCFAQLFAHVRDRFAATDIPGLPKGLAVSVVRVCFSLAWTVGPSLGAWMQIGYGFRGLFFGAAALFVLFMVGVLLFVPYERPSAQSRAAIREPVWQILTRGDILAASVAFFLIYAASAMDMLNLPLLLTGDLHGSRVDLGIAYGVGPIFEMPLMLWFGYLAGRGRQLILIRAAAAIGLAYYLSLGLAAAPLQVFFARALSGALVAIISNVAILFFQDLVPGQAGLATTVFYNAAYSGNLAGYIIFGATVERIGHRGIAFIGAALSAGMGIILFLNRPRHHTGRMDPAAAPPPLPIVESGA